MRADIHSFTYALSGLLSSMWTQVRAGLAVGLPAEDESRLGAGTEAGACNQLMRHAVRSLDDYAGYQTRNGLGSMNIGGGGSRIDE